MFLDHQVHTPWATLRAQLATHRGVTVVLPTAAGLTLRIRKGATREPEHREISGTLQIPSEIIPAVRSWSSP